MKERRKTVGENKTGKEKDPIKSGSITVEAAFVMPIVIFTIFALIYLAYFLHDYCRIQGAMDKVLNKAAVNVKHEADIATGKVCYEAIGDRGILYLITGNMKEEEKQILNLLNQELSSGLFITKITNTQAEAGRLKITITIEAKAEVTLPYFQRLFDRFTSIRIKDSYPVHNPAETLRGVEVILDTGSEIKGVKDFIEKLNSFFK